jgi:hypothetical protein
MGLWDVLDYGVLQRALDGVNKDYASYLRKIADEVDELVSKPQNKNKFVEHTDQFVKMFYAHKKALKELEERIKFGKLTDNVLLLYDTLKDALKGLPTNPMDWFLTHDDTKTIGFIDFEPSISELVNNINLQQNRTGLPIDEQQEIDRCFYNLQPEPPSNPLEQELLMCFYVRLTVIHDLVRTTPQDTPIYFKPNYEGDPNPLEVAGRLWGRIVKIIDVKNIEIEKGLTEKALAEVKADLQQQAERGGNATAAKGWWVTTFFKNIIEKGWQIFTKSFWDSVFERWGPK